LDAALFQRKDGQGMEVNFHLPGLRQNLALNMVLLSMLEKRPQYFREGVRIASFFGEFPMSLWNGGRRSPNDQCDAGFIENAIRSINAKGVSVRYTYTNMFLDEEDLKDPYCNFCMKAADNGQNGILVVSPLLEDYVRKTYPRFRINSSTCKEIRDIDAVNEELEKDYHLVVLDYNFNNRFEELEKIKDKGRCEILVNAVCQPDCKRRGKHYENEAKNQKIMLKNRTRTPERQIPLEPWHCDYGEHNEFHTIQSYCTYVSPEDIWEKYVPMGFRNFKLEGRTANLFYIMEVYCHYLIRPEYRVDAATTLLNSLAANRLITVARPKPAKWEG